MMKFIMLIFGWINKFFTWAATVGRKNEIKKIDADVYGGNDASDAERLRQIRERYEAKRNSAG